MFEIIHRYTKVVLYKSETATDTRAAVVEAVSRGANLRGAYLGGAYLGGADLGGAYLGGADLGGAYLGGAYLGGAYLRGAYLEDADLEDANLGGAYLGGAKGLLSQPIPPLQICGTRHWIVVREDGHLTIGCHHLPLVEWEARYKAIGRAEGYSDAEVVEYAAHIAHCRAWMEAHGVVNVIAKEVTAP